MANSIRDVSCLYIYADGMTYEDTFPCLQMLHSAEDMQYYEAGGQIFGVKEGCKPRKELERMIPVLGIIKISIK